MRGQLEAKLNRNEAFHQKSGSTAVQAGLGYFSGSLHDLARNKYILLGVCDWVWCMLFDRSSVGRASDVAVAIWLVDLFEKSLASEPQSSGLNDAFSKLEVK